jgi:hypothetical protein
MLLTIFAWLDRKPLPAGIPLGLLTPKPQLGALFPVMLVASGRWRVFLVALAMAIQRQARPTRRGSRQTALLAAAHPDGAGNSPYSRPGPDPAGVRALRLVRLKADRATPAHDAHARAATAVVLE